MQTTKKWKQNQKRMCVLFWLMWIVKLRIWFCQQAFSALPLSLTLSLSHSLSLDLKSVASLLSMRTNRTALRSSAAKSDACFCRKWEKTRKKKSVHLKFSLYYGFWHVSSYFLFFNCVFDLCAVTREKIKNPLSLSCIILIVFVRFAIVVSWICDLCTQLFGNSNQCWNK